VNQKAFLEVFVAISCVIITLSPAHSAAEPAPVVVCYPGGPINDSEANNGMAAMLRVLEHLGQWPDQTFSSFFTSNADECRNLLSTKKPAFAITSLGLFLEERPEHNLLPIVQPQMRGTTTETYRLIVKKGKFQNLDQLKGKLVGGTVFEEPDFIKRIVFRNHLDPANYFQLKPSRQAIRALRALDKDELDAVLLNGQQFSALGSLQLGSPLEAIFTSEAIPLMGLVANEKSSTAAERSRFANALSSMCSDPEGKKLCDLFGVESFKPTTITVFSPMISLWNQGK